MTSSTLSGASASMKILQRAGMNDRGGHLEWEHEPREGEGDIIQVGIIRMCIIGQGMFTHVIGNGELTSYVIIITQLLSISQTSILLSFSHTHKHTHTHTSLTHSNTHISSSTHTQTHAHTCNHTLIMSLRFKALVDIVRNEQQHAELF